MPVQTRRSVKRALDDSDLSGEERAAKRPSTPFFRRTEPSFHERARSARKATPTRPTRPIRPYSASIGTRFRDDGSDNTPQLMPMGEEKAPERVANTAPATPQERTQQSTMGWLWNSARRYIPGLRPEDTAPATTAQPTVERSASPSPSDGIPPLSPLEALTQPFEYPRPETSQDPLEEDYQILRRMRPNTMEDFNWAKRHKKWDFAAKAIEREERLKFNTKQVLGSNKRKITEEREEPAEPSTPPRNTFQPPSVEDDDEDELADATAPPKQAESVKTPDSKQSQAAPSPLKSALRTGTKSKLNVGFDESTTIKSFNSETPVQTRWRDYGPAGHYTGTTFLDPMDPKNKKHFQRLAEKAKHAEDDSLGPYVSTDPKFHLPNVFGLSDEDIEYGELSEEEEAQLAEQDAAQATATPNAPRIPHAELPSGPKQGDRVITGETPPSFLNAGGRLFKPTEAAYKQIEEQRKLANKYKPKKTSGLSYVEPARSHSSSPTRGESTAMTATADADIEVPALSDDNGDASDEITSPTSPPTQPVAALTPSVELDNIVKGDDGMTAYEREHQYDDWAANLDWPEPQTYVEAGVCSAFIDDLLRKKWTKADEKLTREWWTKEFNDVDRMMEEAKRNGQRLELVYGDDIDDIEQ